MRSWKFFIVFRFGIACYISARTLASRVIGTVPCMPPERLRGEAGDARGDLYSLGCVLYELPTSRTPFGDLDISALMYAHHHLTHRSVAGGRGRHRPHRQRR